MQEPIKDTGDTPGDAVGKEPTIITIPQGSAALPGESSQFKVGDSLTLTGKITVADESGITVEVAQIEKAPEAAPDEIGGGASDEPAAVEDSENPQADYVSGRRNRAMAEA